MLSSVVEKRINDISTIADELSHIIPRDGWTDYAISLFARLQKLSIILDDENERADDMYDAFKKALSDQWITTENGHKVHLGDDGKPDKGNPHVLEAIQGAVASSDAKYRKEGMRCEQPVEFENSGSVTRDKFGRQVHHFNHDENEMKVTRRIRADGKGGRSYVICDGKIEHLTVFAADDMKRKVDVAEKLASQVGGDAKSWKHVKGIGTVLDKNNKRRQADIHWFESSKVGQVLFKVKDFLEDMDESKIYWKKE